MAFLLLMQHYPRRCRACNAHGLLRYHAGRRPAATKRSHPLVTYRGSRHMHGKLCRCDSRAGGMALKGTVCTRPCPPAAPPLAPGYTGNQSALLPRLTECYDFSALPRAFEECPPPPPYPIYTSPMAPPVARLSSPSPSTFTLCSSLRSGGAIRKHPHTALALLLDVASEKAGSPSSSTLKHKQTFVLAYHARSCARTRVARGSGLSVLAGFLQPCSRAAAPAARCLGTAHTFIPRPTDSPSSLLSPSFLLSQWQE